MATAVEPALLTVEEFAQLPDPGYPTELVKGRVVALPLPTPRHGQICLRVGRLIGNHAEAADLGHVVGNDSGLVTARGPDTLRGADVAFYPFTLVPRGPLPGGYLTVVPTLVFEVLSPEDRWARVLLKVAEYLDAGVAIVVVLDPKTSRASVFRPEGRIEDLGPEDEFSAPDVLGEFRVVVGRFFG